jgi:hypothetical protein
MAEQSGSMLDGSRWQSEDYGGDNHDGRFEPT